jgi:hypothetical protein
MTTRRGIRAVLLLAVGLLVIQTGTALAQESSESDWPERKVIVWTNPILFVFTWYMAEIEIGFANNHTFGVSGSFLETETDDPGDPDYEENKYTAGFAFYRYYPTASFKGFFIGGQLGVGDVSTKDNFTDDSGSFLLRGCSSATAGCSGRRSESV